MNENKLSKISITKDDCNRIENLIRNTISKYSIEIEKKVIEKIAFSLFSMYYYNQDFTPGFDEFYYNVRIKGLLETWGLGKEKNKLKFFFDLAEKIYKLNFNN